jgi:hypothetical protein
MDDAVMKAFDSFRVDGMKVPPELQDWMEDRTLDPLRIAVSFFFYRSFPT